MTVPFVSLSVLFCAMVWKCPQRPLLKVEVQWNETGYQWHSSTSFRNHRTPPTPPLALSSCNLAFYFLETFLCTFSYSLPFHWTAKNCFLPLSSQLLALLSWTFTPFWEPSFCLLFNGFCSLDSIRLHLPQQAVWRSMFQKEVRREKLHHPGPSEGWAVRCTPAYSASYLGSGGPELRSYACSANTLPTKPSPNSISIFELSYKSDVDAKINLVGLQKAMRCIAVMCAAHTAAIS